MDFLNNSHSFIAIERFIQIILAYSDKNYLKMKSLLVVIISCLLDLLLNYYYFLELKLLIEIIAIIMISEAAITAESKYF